MNLLIFICLFLFSIFIAIKDMKQYSKIYSKYKLFLIISSVLLFIISIIFLNKLMTFTQIIIIALYPIGLSHFIIDLIDNELPDISNLVIALYGILNLLLLYLEGNNSIKDISMYLLSSILLFSAYFLLAMITGGQLGGGDIKLIGALGLFFPFNSIMPLAILPFFIGGILATILLIKYYLIDKKYNKEKPQTMPFGPSIIISFILLIFI